MDDTQECSELDGSTQRVGEKTGCPTEHKELIPSTGNGRKDLGVRDPNSEFSVKLLDC